MASVFFSVLLLGAVDTSRLVPCSYLDHGNTSGPYAACIDFSTSSLGACQDYDPPSANRSGRDSDIFECGCVALVGDGPRAQSALTAIHAWEMRQAMAQFSLSLLSIVLGVSYLLLFAIRYDKMARYPQSLAFWMYVCDLFKSVSLCVVAGLRLFSGPEEGASVFDSAALGFSRMSGALAADEYLTPAWVHTSSAPCLCDAADSHPGCACRGGWLATMLQVRLQALYVLAKRWPLLGTVL